MLYLNANNAISYLYKDNASNVTESMVLETIECINNGFDDEDLERLYSSESIAELKEHYGSTDIDTLDKEIKLSVTYQAEEYVFEINVETLLDVRKDNARTYLGKLIGNAIKEKINNSGEITAFQKV